MLQAIKKRPKSWTGRKPRVLFYSHDTFGLGHLRRSHAIASAITADNPEMSALILTGSPVAGRFAFPKRVDYVRLPGVTKKSDGSYVPETLGLDIEETTVLRAGLIKATVEIFDPDLFIVDKEPTGFRGELMPALHWLKRNSPAKLVLGLRDVLDEPDVLAAEWSRKGAVEVTADFYDDIWVYGLESIYDPTLGLNFPPAVRDRMHFTGYIRRKIARERHDTGEPYILITPGGGGDGEALVNLVLSAYEQDPDLSPKAVLVYGPFLASERSSEFEARVEKLGGRVRTLGFESKIENLFAGAQGVISMGGYNTFCEVLSFDKPAVIVPRTVPRLEQYIRACRAEELGLVRMIDEGRDGMTPAAMIAAIRNLPLQSPPSACVSPGLLDGLDKICERVRDLTRADAEAKAV